MFLALLLIAGGLWTAPSHAQGATGIIRGQAREGNGTPVVGATISASVNPGGEQEVARAVTGADGSYELTVPAGQTLWVNFLTFKQWWGYSYLPQLTLQAGQTMTGVDFVLGPRDVSTPVVAPPAPAPLPPAPTPEPPGMPTTGAANVLPMLGVGLGLALLLLLAGDRIRRRA
jgi:hypothetical protein